MFGNIGTNDFGFEFIHAGNFASSQRNRDARERSERRMAQMDRSLDLRERGLEERERHHKEQELQGWAKIDETIRNHDMTMGYKRYMADMKDYQFEYKANERFQKRQDMNDRFNQQMALKWARENRMANREHQGGK